MQGRSKDTLKRKRVKVQISLSCLKWQGRMPSGREAYILGSPAQGFPQIERIGRILRGVNHESTS